MSDERYELREGWVWAKIEDTVQPVGQFNPSATPEAVYRYVDVSSISNQRFEIDAPKIVSGATAPTRARQAIRPGDVLFSTVRPYLRNVALVRKHTDGDVGSTAFCVLRSNGSVEPKYLFQWTLTKDFSESLVPKQRGISYPAVRDADVLAQAIPLAPLAEQKRIMAKIEALFGQSRTARQALERIPPLLKKFRQSVLAAAFRGDLTRDWREQNPDVEPASAPLERIHVGSRDQFRNPRSLADSEVDTNNHPQLPPTWLWARIRELSQDSRGITYGVIKLGPNREGGIPTLRSSDVRWLELDLSSVKKIAFEIASRYRRTFLQGGEVLVTVRGTLGGVAYVPPTCKGFNVSREVAVVPVAPGVSGEWLAYIIGSPQVQRSLGELVRGVAYMGVNIEDLKEIPVPVPPTLEQGKIVARIQELFVSTTAIEAAVGLTRRRAEKLDQSILGRGFRGELVPQDPNDEPASAILERINAGQAKRDGRRERA